MTDKPTHARALVPVLAVLLSLAVPLPSFAAAGAEMEEVVVTGSRVKRGDFSSASPITVITGQSIVESGFNNIGEVLRQQAAAGTAGFNQSSILSGGGSSSVDLRNLGQERVLVLINGKRVASFADALQNQAADLTFVPTAMVERVDILRDGAAAAYGADAITGVINIILKENFEGVEMGASTGLSDEDDGQSYDFDFAIGNSGDRGSMVMGMQYRYQNNVRQTDRADWAFPNISSLTGTVSNGSSFHPGGLFLGDLGGVFCTTPKVMGGDEITDDPNCPSFAPRQAVNSPDQVKATRYDYGLQQDVFGAS
jgi:iron complex outermembrane receptor protein